MPPKIGRCPTKIETHPHKEKKFQNMAVGSSRRCRGVLLPVDRLRPSWRWTRTTPRWKGRRGLWTVLPVATHWQRTTTWQLAKSDTRKPVKIDNISRQLTSHKPTVRQLRQPSRCTNPISTTTNNNIPWDSDTHVFIRLISPMSVGLVFHRLYSFHPVQT